MRRVWCGLGAAMVLAVGACGSDDGDSDGGSSVPPLLSKSIEPADLPGGWVINADANDVPLPECAIAARQRLAAPERQEVAYERDVNGPYLTETVSRFDPGTAPAALTAAVDALLACDDTEFMAGSTPLVSSVDEIPLPPQGEESRSVAITVEGNGVNYLANVTVIRVGDLLATLTYSDLFLLDPTTSLEFMATAARKLSQ